MPVFPGGWSGSKMKHPKLREWDKKLKRICDEVDSWLEDHYGNIYRLRPNRPSRGQTFNPEMDGLFNVQAVFTPGYRSEKGRGYLIEIELSTFEAIDSHVKKEIDETVIVMIKERLLTEFPGRKLDIGFDGTMIKIWGDLSLGSV
jgi:hypothetical protein